MFDTIINLSLISRKLDVPLEKVLDSVNEKRREGPGRVGKVSLRRMVAVCALT